MVSLKSFKPINEAERDSASGVSSDAAITMGAREASGQPGQHQLSAVFSESSGPDRSTAGYNQFKSEHMRVMNNNNNDTNIASDLQGPAQINDMAHLDAQAAATNKTVVTVSLPTNVGADAKHPTSQVSPSSSSISIVVVQHDSGASVRGASTSPEDTQEDVSSQSTDTLEDSSSGSPQRSRGMDVTPELPREGAVGVGELYRDQNVFRTNLQMYEGARQDEKAPRRFEPSAQPTSSDHFEIVWSNLSYKIEPKWYKKINLLDKALSYVMPGQTVDNHSSATSTASSSAGMNDNQHQMHTSTNVDSHLNAPLKVKSPTDPIEIFSNLNGTITSGQMTAVLGPSGAGKTTLLNCLTGKLRNGVSGHINLKGANGKHLKMCTIPQKDHLLELLTVEENLWFASKIKNPEYGFDHVKNIERVIDLLGLKRCRSAKIKKISGGQHKRVSIAQELLSNPDILVLDEPTSGLDSLTCFKTISMLRDLVELSASNDFMKPMAIIVTIHQPQPKVFNLFHHVYILANGGRVIYEGAPELSLATITSVTGLQPGEGAKSSSVASGAVDPASFLIEIASEEYGSDIINTLNDYQRHVFHETNVSNYNQHRDGPLRDYGKDNYAYSPDLGPERKAKCLPAVLVTSDLGGSHTKERQHQQPRDTNYASKGRSPKISASNDVESNAGSQVKRRKKSTHSLDSEAASCAFSQSSAGDSSHTNKFSTSDSGGLYMSEQLLYTRVSNHEGRFWSHTATLAHRTLLTIRRDPLLMTSRVLFHLMIPLLMGYVYGKATGAANACPHYEPEIDITQIPSLVEGKRIEYMLEELHMSIENVSMFFIIMYAFAAAVLALNALSFPLNMQVLLKETRNGWYSMSSYVLAKTLADLPLELTMPCLTMALVYPLTGQPSSYMQWRMLTICLIMTLCSLIAQTQALILGALVMSSVQTAVFVSQASQLPWVILAGFTIRIKRLSEPLKLISLTSFYRLGCEAITLTRYGFGICPCNPDEITGEPVRLVGIPDQLRTVAQYWIDSVEASKAAGNESAPIDGTEDQIATTTTLAPATGAGPKTDIFQHLANQLSYANSYGVNITSCDDVAPDRIRAINLSDNWLVARIWHLFIMLIIMKVLLYYAVKFSIGIRL